MSLNDVGYICTDLTTENHLSIRIFCLLGMEALKKRVERSSLPSQRVGTTRMGIINVCHTIQYESANTSTLPYLTLPFLYTLPYPTLPYLTLPYLPYLTLPFLYTLPYPTLPYPTLPYLPYLTLPFLYTLPYPTVPTLHPTQKQLTFFDSYCMYR